MPSVQDIRAGRRSVGLLFDGGKLVRGLRVVGALERRGRLGHTRPILMVRSWLHEAVHGWCSWAHGLCV